ncbi:hypothetical protein KFK09_001040 [Dendrobium nobile]|uniref:Uncharacterized protein n=1 Tax=Dendrobium nobile TaxID=94219 RepID=A0A8T3CA56_DENNO|nr:hypothetical protein KFK09_001040 [Dendrobium nobile]
MEALRKIFGSDFAVVTGLLGSFSFMFWLVSSRSLWIFCNAPRSFTMSLLVKTCCVVYVMHWTMIGSICSLPLDGLWATKGLSIKLICLSHPAFCILEPFLLIVCFLCVSAKLKFSKNKK